MGFAGKGITCVASQMEDLDFQIGKPGFATVADVMMFLHELALCHEGSRSLSYAGEEQVALADSRHEAQRLVGVELLRFRLKAAYDEEGLQEDAALAKEKKEKKLADLRLEAELEGAATAKDEAAAAKEAKDRERAQKKKKQDIADLRLQAEHEGASEVLAATAAARAAEAHQMEEQRRALALKEAELKRHTEETQRAAAAAAAATRHEREQLDLSLRAVHDQKCDLQRQTAEHKRRSADAQKTLREAGTAAAEMDRVRHDQAAEEQKLQQERDALAQKEADLNRDFVAAGQYEWLDEQGAWNPYLPDINKKILAAATTAAACSFDHGGHTYRVTTRFPMFQTNVKFNTPRHVRLTGGPADEQFMREAPKYWKAGTDATETVLVELDRSNPDMKVAFEEVVALVTRECAIDVLSVHVLQDPAKWKAYNVKKQNLEAKLAGGANERRVVHGGAEASIRSIALMGFVREFNTTSVYGKGTYFARDMSYSANNRYTPPNASGEKFAFLARVLVGEPCVGTQGMNMPDVKPGGALHDSMVNNLADPSIFVLSSGSDEHAYPEFMVKFKFT